jgi:hypothetical protein
MKIKSAVIDDSDVVIRKLWIVLGNFHQVALIGALWWNYEIPFDVYPRTELC